MSLRISKAIRLRLLCDPQFGAIITALLACGGFLSFFLISVVMIGPALEEKFFPVLINEQYSDMSLSEDKKTLCWTYSAIKERHARLDSSSWILIYDKEKIDNVVPTLYRQPFEFRTYDLGPFKIGPMCAILPQIGEVPINKVYKDVRLTSIKAYTTNSLWILLHHGPLVPVPRE